MRFPEAAARRWRPWPLRATLPARVYFIARASQGFFDARYLGGWAEGATYAQATQHKYATSLFCIEFRASPWAAPGLRCQRSPTRLLNGWRLTVHAPRLFRIITSTHQAPCLLSSYNPGSTRRCLTSLFEIPGRSRHSVSFHARQPFAALSGGRCTCQDYQRPALRLVSAVAGVSLGRRPATLWFPLLCTR